METSNLIIILVLTFVVIALTAASWDKIIYEDKMTALETCYGEKDNLPYDVNCYIRTDRTTGSQQQLLISLHTGRIMDSCDWKPAQFNVSDTYRGCWE